MMTKKTYYRVPKLLEKEYCFLADLPCGVWCTDTLKWKILRRWILKRLCMTISVNVLQGH